MKPADWDAWLRKWLSRHPLKAPPARLLERFSEEVLARIRPREAPAPVSRPRWTLQPRWGLAWSGALAAALALVVFGLRPTGGPLEIADQESQILLGVSVLEDWEEHSLEEELEESDRIVLAEAIGPKEEAQILKLWEELEEADEAPSPEELGSEEEILEALRWVDEEELAVS